jgi:F420-0:gamma-glutamyl ligase
MEGIIMIKEGIQANILNVRALVNKNPEVLANEMSKWLREAGQKTGVIIHDISFVQTPEGTCAMLVFRGPVH